MNISEDSDQVKQQKFNTFISEYEESVRRTSQSKDGSVQDTLLVDNESTEQSVDQIKLHYEEKVSQMLREHKMNLDEVADINV